jgi:hypothetical protein
MNTEPRAKGGRFAPKQKPIEQPLPEPPVQQALVPITDSDLIPRDEEGKFLSKEDFQTKKRQGREKFVLASQRVSEMTLEELQPAPGDSALVLSLKASYLNTINSGPDGLMGQSKFIESQAKIQSVFEPTPEELFPIKVVHIHEHISLDGKTDQRSIPWATKPSWISGEVVEQAPAKTLDVIEESTPEMIDVLRPDGPKLSPAPVAPPVDPSVQQAEDAKVLARSGGEYRIGAYAERE